MKKLFTLFAAAALALSAQAKPVEDVNYVYGVNMTEWALYEMGYKPVIKDGVLWSENPVNEETGEKTGWYQYFMMPAFSATIGTTYDVTFKVKGSVEGQVNVQARWSLSEDALNAVIPVTTSWEEVTVHYAEVGGTNIDLIFQSGAYAGEIEWAWIKVSHEEKEGKPVEWIELLTNGDASQDWEHPEWEITGDGANYPENFGDVCAWSKIYGGNPMPATIEEIDGNRVFVVHATAKEQNDWDNQFWINMPKAMTSGDVVRLKFRYKASGSGTSAIQGHRVPSSYLNNDGGSASFTEDWQQFDKQITLSGETQSFAFNLNSGFEAATDFYFDDLSVSIMKLDEGYFVAGDFNDWDLDEAVEMVLNEEEGFYEVTVGTTDKGATELKISTKRGNASAFDANTIQVTDAVEDDADTWNDWKKTGGDNPTLTHGKIKLPFPGVWKIYLDPEYEAMAFECVESADGPVKVEETCRRVEVKAGAKTAEAWDNQFWFVANRTLAAGEVTHIKFECKADEEATIGTQSHEAPGNYIHWAACGSITFKEDWTTFEADFTIPSQCDGTENSNGYMNNFKSIALNLSEFADANTYMFRNISWTCGDESLISNGDLATDDATSFVAKTNSDEATAGQLLPAAIVGGETSINAVNADVKNAPIFNLSGQRVNNAKGLVIKNGKVMFVK